MVQALRTEAAILNGASQSGIVDCSWGMIAAIHIPDSWTAANITFLVAESADGDFSAAYDSDGNELTVTVGGADRTILIAPQAFAGARFLKLRSGTAAAAVNQGADRTLILTMVPYT